MKAHEVLAREVPHEEVKHGTRPTHLPSLSLTYEVLNNSCSTGTAEVNTTGKKGVTANLVLNGQKVKFELNSGAACYVLRQRSSEERDGTAYK